MNSEPQRIAEILVVEDSDSDYDLLEMGYRRLSFKKNLHHVVDGQEALDFIQCKGDYPSDLILLELNMPGIHGHEILEYLKSHDDFASIPVVVLSTSNYQQDICRAYQNHANGYMTKDFGFAIMKSLLTLSRFWFSSALLPTGAVMPPGENTKSETELEGSRVGLQCLGLDAWSFQILEEAAAGLDYDLSISKTESITDACKRYKEPHPWKPLVTLVGIQDGLGADGDIVAKLRGMPEFQSAPTLAYSDSPSEEVVATCYRQFANAVISQPSSVEDATQLLDSIVKWFSMVD